MRWRDWREAGAQSAIITVALTKFYREDGARSSKKGGAGLGLAIAREIVVAHHGDIEAASERGVTVFTLRIPTQGEGIEGAAAAPRIPGATEGVQRLVLMPI